MPAFPATHRRVISRAFLDAGIPPPEPAMEVSTVVFFAALVRDTDMLTVMPRIMLKEDGNALDIVALPVEFSFPPEQIGLAYRENARLLPGAKIVMERIKTVCAETQNAGVR